MYISVMFLATYISIIICSCCSHLALYSTPGLVRNDLVQKKSLLAVPAACSFWRVLPCWVWCALSVGTLLPLSGICASFILVVCACLLPSGARHLCSVHAWTSDPGLLIIVMPGDIWSVVKLTRAGGVFLLCALPAWKRHGASWM